MQEWKEHGFFDITEQRLCDQARAIGKMIGSLIWSFKIFGEEAESEIVNESIEVVEENQTERNIVRTSERNEQTGYDSDEPINNVAANVETLDEETHFTIAQLNKILTGSRNTDGISFQKVDMNTLNRTTAKLNRVTELIEIKNPRNPGK